MLSMIQVLILITKIDLTVDDLCGEGRRINILQTALEKLNIHKGMGNLLSTNPIRNIRHEIRPSGVEKSDSASPRTIKTAPNLPGRTQ